jgi:hypothetical protein
MPQYRGFPHNRSALFACHSTRILSSYALNIGAVSGFTITRITGHHAVIIQVVKISFSTFVVLSWPHSFLTPAEVLGDKILAVGPNYSRRIGHSPSFDAA